jgi:predicted RNA-binding Zn-ribbon protein involved in translation (DUF1610 family)
MMKGRRLRAEFTDIILYELLKSGGIGSEERLSKAVLQNFEREKPSRSTFQEHLHRLELLGFITVKPTVEGKRVRNSIQPDLLACLYGVYRTAATEGWNGIDRESLIDQACSKLLTHLQSNIEFLENLFRGDAERCALFKMLSLLTERLGKDIFKMHAETLAELCKGVFEECMLNVTLKGKKWRGIDLSMFEQRYSFMVQQLYRWLAETILSAYAREVEKGADDLADLWLTSFTEVLAMMPESERASLAASFRASMDSYYRRLLRGLPPIYGHKYSAEVAKTKPDEVAYMVKCPQCGELNISRGNVADLVAGREIECPKCGKKLPLKLCRDERFLEGFLKWDRQEMIPKHVMPLLVKLEEMASSITCQVLAQTGDRRAVARDAPVAIRGFISPPHPKSKVFLEITDPEGEKKHFEALTDDSGSFEVLIRFGKCGEWSISPYWLGDEDHYGSKSTRTVLVFEFPRE